MRNARRVVHWENGEGGMEPDLLSRFMLVDPPAKDAKLWGEEGKLFELRYMIRLRPYAVRIDGSYPERWQYVMRLTNAQAAGLITDHCHSLSPEDMDKCYLNKGYHIIPQGEHDHDYLEWLEERVESVVHYPDPRPGTVAVYLHDGQFWLIRRGE